MTCCPYRGALVGDKDRLAERTEAPVRILHTRGRNQASYDGKTGIGVISHAWRLRGFRGWEPTLHNSTWGIFLDSTAM